MSQKNMSCVGCPKGLCLRKMKQHRVRSLCKSVRLGRCAGYLNDEEGGFGVVVDDEEELCMDGCLRPSWLSATCRP